MERKAAILILIRLILVMLWVPVAVDKLWNLAKFHSTLLRQQFPDAWADILFWLLPLLELLAAVLIAWPHSQAGDSASRTKVAETSPATYTASTVGQRRPARSGEAASAHPNPRVSSTAGQRRIARGGAVAPPTLRLGLVLSTFLMLAFTLFILFGVLGWYDKRPCGCGSVISGLSWEQHLWFNIAFLLISIIGLWLTRKRNPQNHPPHLSFRRQEKPHDTQAPYSDKGYRLFKKMFPRKFALFRRRAVRHQLFYNCFYDVEVIIGEAR